jgi:hypothetical protein
LPIEGSIGNPLSALGANMAETRENSIRSIPGFRHSHGFCWRVEENFLEAKPNPGVIRKSVQRFSGKIMPIQRAKAR